MELNNRNIVLVVCFFHLKWVWYGCKQWQFSRFKLRYSCPMQLVLGFFATMWRGTMFHYTFCSLLNITCRLSSQSSHIIRIFCWWNLHIMHTRTHSGPSYKNEGFPYKVKVKYVQQQSTKVTNVKRTFHSGFCAPVCTVNPGYYSSFSRILLSSLALNLKNG